MALLDLGKPTKKARTIWNRNYLEFRGQPLEEYGKSTCRNKEVLLKANKIRKKSPQKRKEPAGAVIKPVSCEMMKRSIVRNSTRCVSNTNTTTPTSLDATARRKDSLPAQQQRRRMSTPWLYRCWLFRQE
ncbi:hypothetical protein Aduo_015953 [Ancylostoma duodenale]